MFRYFRLSFVSSVCWVIPERRETLISETFPLGRDEWKNDTLPWGRLIKQTTERGRGRGDVTFINV